MRIIKTLCFELKDYSIINLFERQKKVIYYFKLDFIFSCFKFNFIIKEEKAFKVMFAATIIEFVEKITTMQMFEYLFENLISLVFQMLS